MTNYEYLLAPYTRAVYHLGGTCMIYQRHVDDTITSYEVERKRWSNDVTAWVLPGRGELTSSFTNELEVGYQRWLADLILDVPEGDDRRSSGAKQHGN